VQFNRRRRVDHPLGCDDAAPSLPELRCAARLHAWRYRAPMAGLFWNPIDIAAAMAVIVCGAASQYGVALPGASVDLSGQRGGAALVEKTHGFHCRPVLGWDPRAGVYHVHRHEGICKDYQGCWRQSQNCIFMLGRGWGLIPQRDRFNHAAGGAHGNL
jgi:hypothetical protein